MKLSGKQVALIILTVICTALLIYWIYFLAENLINVTIRTVINYPNHPSRNIFIKSIWLSIGFQSSFILVYALYLWLAISAFVQELKRRRPRPEPADK